MKINSPQEDLESLVLESMSIRGDGSVGNGINVLLVAPELAKNTEINAQLLRVLGSRAIGYRNYAAMVLDDIGDPRGLQHLVYNTLSNHPEFGYDNYQTSGRGDGWLKRRANRLPDEFVETLAKDMRRGVKYRHVDCLSAAPAGSVLKYVKPMLDEKQPTRLFAAYLCVWHGDLSGLPYLLEAGRRGIAPRMVLRALARAGTDEALQGIADLPSAAEAMLEDWNAERLRSECATWLELCKAQRSGWFIEKFKQRYTLDVSDLTNVMQKASAQPHNKQIQISWMSIPEGTGIRVIVRHRDNWFDRAGDALFTLASPEQCAQLAAFQRNSVNAFFDLEEISETEVGPYEHDGIAPHFMWDLHPTGKRTDWYYPRGFTIDYDRDELLSASTTWIEHPRTGLFGVRDLDRGYS